MQASPSLAWSAELGTLLGEHLERLLSVLAGALLRRCTIPQLLLLGVVEIHWLNGVLLLLFGDWR